MYAKLIYDYKSLHDEYVEYIIYIINESSPTNQSWWIRGKVLWTNYYKPSTGKSFIFSKDDNFVSIEHFETEEELLKKYMLELI